MGYLECGKFLFILHPSTSTIITHIFDICILKITNTILNILKQLDFTHLSNLCTSCVVFFLIFFDNYFRSLKL